MLHPARTRMGSCLLAALALISGATPRPQTPDELLERARAALDAGNAAEAERVYRQALAGDCRCPMGHLGLAESLLRQGRSQEAATEAARGAALYLQRGQADEALAALDAAHRTDPSSAEVARLRGQALLDLERYGEAAEQLAEAKRLGSRDLETDLLRAAALWEAGDLEASESEYREAVQISDGAPVALHQLGSLLLWQGRYEEARDCLSTASDAAPGVPDLALDLGRALEGTGDLEGAVVAYRRAVTAAPDNSGARYALGRVLVRLGRAAEAREHLDAYRRLYEAEQRYLHDSKLAAARLDAAWEKFSAGDAKAALEELERAPRTPDVLAATAAVQTALGNPSEAVALLERAVAMAPDRRDLQLQLSRARLAMEQRR